MHPCLIIEWRFGYVDKKDKSGRRKTPDQTFTAKWLLLGRLEHTHATTRSTRNLWPFLFPLSSPPLHDHKRKRWWSEKKGNKKSKKAMVRTSKSYSISYPWRATIN